MTSHRQGQGRRIDTAAWPESGPVRAWLEYCDRVHRENGPRSLSELVADMHLNSRTRVSDMLRGKSLPASPDQARALLAALGAVGPEVNRGLRLYQAARLVLAAATPRRPRRPEWWRRSGYLLQVRDIAPVELLDRAAELAELVDWVNGDDAYVWWQAPPLAGKTALMSWFVAHPPERAWVVSFFVTARLTAQSDSAAFTDAMLDQLAAIAGEEATPQVTAPIQRERVRRELLEKAADRAQKAGVRLVLVVDGLDEDRGAELGSGLASIAASLPRRPPPGLRVIVAGRPDPPPPHDVNPDHPLLSCPVRALAPSPYAREVAKQAQSELDHMLKADRHSHDGLGYQVIGLVTASGGGLDHRDLQRLTERPAFELDDLLRDLFGRAIAGRTVAPDSERVFLFTHETLREQAVDRLGPYAIAGFRQRIHAWATEYRLRRWPSGTPAYLLLGYRRMVEDEGDLPRLVGLATDTARQDRMRQVTGGDAAALADIAAAQRRLAADLNLSAALQLAWHREQLGRRNTTVPVRLPAVWAAVGQPVRAEALARSIADPHRQARALATVSAAMIAYGDRAAGEALARTIAGPFPGESADVAPPGTLPAAPGDCTCALVSLVTAVLDSDLESATELTDSWVSQDVLIELVEAAVSGDRAGAEALAWGLTEYELPGETLVFLIETVAALGRDWMAGLPRVSFLGDVTDEAFQTDVVRDLAAAFAAAGDYQRAEEIAQRIPTMDSEAVDNTLVDLAESALAAGRLDDAERIARAVDGPGPRATALAAVARAVAEAGDPDHAEAVARAAEDPGDAGHTLAGLAGIAAEAGDAARAEAIARSLDDPVLRAEALAEAAYALAAGGNRDRAAALAGEAEASARSAAEPGVTATLLSELAEAVTIAGDYRRAEAIVNAQPDRRNREIGLLHLGTVVARFDRRHAEAIALAIDGGYWRAEVLRSVVNGELEAGDIGRAEVVTELIPVPSHRSWALEALVEAFVAAGEMERAEATALSIPEPDVQARSLTVLAQVVVAAGDLRHGEALAGAIPEAHRRIPALIKLAATAPEAGSASRMAELAEAAARAEPEEYWRGKFLADLVRVLAATHIDRAEALARSITHPASQTDALSHVAVALADAGRYRDAYAKAASLRDLSRAMNHLIGAVAADPSPEAVAFARSLSDPQCAAKTLAAMAQTFAAIDRDQARELAVEAERRASTLADHHRIDPLTAVFQTYLAIGALRRAEALATSDDVLGRRPLRDLFRAVAATGDHRWAAAVAEMAEAAIADLRSAYPMDYRNALGDMVDAYAAVADYAHAVALTAAFPEDHYRLQALRNVARAAVANGHSEEAERIARDTGDPDGRSRALVTVASSLADHGDLIRAEAVARTIAEPWNADDAFTHLAEAAAAGDPDRAAAFAAEITDGACQAEVFTQLAEQAGPDRVPALITAALGAGSWQTPLKVLARVEPETLLTFLDTHSPW